MKEVKSAREMVHTSYKMSNNDALCIPDMVVVYLPFNGSIIFFYRVTCSALWCSVEIIGAAASSLFSLVHFFSSFA
jgi:hypothetical protein